MATYENQEEADFNKKIHIGKSGFVENSTFGILSPDGTQKLTRTGRAPFYEYRNAYAMAEGMKEIADDYEVADETVFSDLTLPYIAKLDLAVNVAAADQLPLVVVLSNDPEKKAVLESKLLPLAWSDTFAGQFDYVAADGGDDFKPVLGVQGDVEEINSLLIVEPGQFGLTGNVLKQLDADASSEEIEAALSESITGMVRPNRNHRAHVREGIKVGVEWETQTPITDPEAAEGIRRRHELND